VIRWLRGLPTRWQIALLQALILTLVLGGVGEAVLARQRGELIHAIEDRLFADVHRQSADVPNVFGSTGAGGAQTQPGDEKLRYFLRDLPNTLSSQDTGAAVFDPNGVVIAASAGSVPAPVATPAFVKHAAANGDTAFTSRAGGEPVAAVLVPIKIGGTLAAVAAESASLRPVDAEINRLRDSFVIGWVIAVALATILGASATRRVLRPLERLVHVAHRVGQGDLSQRAGLEPSRNEMAKLGAAFDAMVSQLEEVFAAQRRFIADAAHELRTPLTALSTSTELLLIGADEADPATTQRLLRHLDRELSRLIRLTNDLLTLSVVDAETTMSLQPTDLSVLIKEVGEQVRGLLDGQEFIVAAPPALWVSANPDRLRQVLLNVLDNACKYTPPGGVITLDAAAHDGSIWVTVDDTGIGIPIEAQAKLFQRFYRVDSARARQSGGAGLGLPIVHSLVHAHGGQVAIDSAPGAGTRVRISLPRLPA
jgi:two-component system, OmpR family, sensor kinase